MKALEVLEAKSELPMADLSLPATLSIGAAVKRELITVSVGAGLYPLSDREAARLCALGRAWQMVEPCRPRMRLVGRS